MRHLMYPAAAVALSTVFMSLPAQAQLHHRHQPYSRVAAADSGGFGTGPFSGKAGRRIVFQSGVTASTRVTTRTRSFAVKSYAIQKMASPGGADRLSHQAKASMSRR